MKKKQSIVIWFTGLSGAGKTTLADLVFRKLQNRFKIKRVDGDSFRKKNKKDKSNFTRKDIIENNILIIKYIKSLLKNYDFIIVSVISPLKKTRRIAKSIFKNKYLEIYVKCPLKILKKRDPKKLYRLAKENKIKNLIGYNSKIKYEKSDYYKLTVDTHKLSKFECLNKILMSINIMRQSK